MNRHEQYAKQMKPENALLIYFKFVKTKIAQIIYFY